MVEVIGDSFYGQVMIMPITPDELIDLAKTDLKIAGYIMGFQIHIISQSQFPEKDHQKILIESYQNLFGYDAEPAVSFAFNSATDPTFKEGLAFGIKDIINWGDDPQNKPSGLLLLLNQRESALDDLPF